MKIYKKGNYILFDDGVILNMEHANQTMLNKDSINGSSYAFHSDNLGTINIQFADIRDEFGVAYASISAFDTIIFDATGFSSAGGGSSATFLSVANFSALPDPTPLTGKVYFVSAKQGTYLFGTLKPKGLYYSNGVSWEFRGEPEFATQIDVDAGTISEKWVSPLTFANASKWSNYETSTLLNARDTANRNTDNHTNGTTNKVYTTVEKTKLASLNAELLSFTELTATALVTHTVTTSATATAINLNSDATNRFAKVVFIAPPSGQVSVNINFDAILTNSATNLRIGLHDSSTATTTPTNGWFRVNGDDDGASNGYSAEFILTGLTAGTSYTRYFVATCNYGSTLIRASSSQTGVFAISDLPQPLRIKVEDLGTITILSNPNS